MTLTKERRDEIRAAAMKATPGPWELDEMENRDDRGRFTSYGVSARPSWSPEHPKSVVDTLNSGVMEIITEHDEDGSSSWDAQGQNDCAHIANCDPQTIIALLDALDAAEAERAEPDFWAVHSVTGAHIGLWPNKVHAAPPAPAIPEGWVLVPKDPTTNQLDAGYKAASEARFYDQGPMAVYYAMLSVSPKAGGQQ